jgi:agmatine deiminase
MRLLNGRQMNILELPMPDPVYYGGQRLPVSYTNFYIANAGIIVPTYRCMQDDQAIAVLESCFKDRPVIWDWIPLRSSGALQLALALVSKSGTSLK